MYTYHSNIRYSELGEDGRITLLSLLNYLQDASTFHGNSCGMNTEHFKSIQRAWFINYWDISIKALPSDGESITVGTSPHDRKGLFCYRNFWIKKTEPSSADDNTASDQNTDTSDDSAYFVKADSIWFMVNTETMMPVRPLEEDLKPYGEIKNVLGIELKTRKVNIPDTAELKSTLKVPVRKWMLDTNHHVNNIKYLVIAYEAITDSVDPDYYPSHIRAEYRQAAKLGDTFVITISECDGKYFINMASGDGQDFCHLEFS